MAKTLEKCLTAEEVAFEHRSGFISFHVAYDYLIEQFQIPKEKVMEMLFPPLIDTGDDRLG
tara:strand:+ start:192 stop:374 length:183 start_codon:yes stop_codon:yes gene_type:complete